MAPNAVPHLGQLMFWLHKTSNGKQIGQKRPNFHKSKRAKLLLFYYIWKDSFAQLNSFVQHEKFRSLTLGVFDSIAELK